MNENTRFNELVVAGQCSSVLPEFGRVEDVRRIFGIRRGVLYRLMARGAVRSIVLREPGRRTGCRLIHLASVSELLQRLMGEQAASEISEGPAAPRSGTGVPSQLRMRTPARHG